MCRFKIFKGTFLVFEELFQYIICVGSRNTISSSNGLSKKFQYIICVGSSYVINFFLKYYLVSIHHMCRFKQALKMAFGDGTKFQYIICVGSRKNLMLPNPT